MAVVKLYFYATDPETGDPDVTWRCKVSTTQTAYYVSDSRGKYKRVSFASFRKYIPSGDFAELWPRSKFSWTWKTDSRGVRYRYIRSMWISKYVG